MSVANNVQDMKDGYQQYEDASQVRAMNFDSDFTMDCNEYPSERLQIACKEDKYTSSNWSAGR